MNEPTLYIKIQSKYDLLIVSLYVNDLIYIGNNKKMIQEFKDEDIQDEKLGLDSLLMYLKHTVVKQ